MTSLEFKTKALELLEQFRNENELSDHLRGRETLPGHVLLNILQNMRNNFTDIISELEQLDSVLVDAIDDLQSIQYHVQTATDTLRQEL